MKMADYCNEISEIYISEEKIKQRIVDSFFDNWGLFANYTYILSYWIIAVQEVVALKNQKYHLYLSDDEYRQVIQSLVSLKNSLTAQGRYTDAVDDVLCKVLGAKKKKLKIEYI